MQGFPGGWSPSQHALELHYSFRSFLYIFCVQYFEFICKGTRPHTYQSLLSNLQKVVQYSKTHFKWSSPSSSSRAASCSTSNVDEEAAVREGKQIENSFQGKLRSFTSLFFQAWEKKKLHISIIKIQLSQAMN